MRPAEKGVDKKLPRLFSGIDVDDAEGAVSFVCSAVGFSCFCSCFSSCVFDRLMNDQGFLPSSSVANASTSSSAANVSNFFFNASCAVDHLKGNQLFFTLVFDAWLSIDVDSATGSCAFSPSSAGGAGIPLLEFHVLSGEGASIASGGGGGNASIPPNAP